VADIVQIGIAYDTSQLTTGSRQVQSAMQQLVQAERQAETASEQLARSSTQTAQALHQEQQAAQRNSQGMQQASQSTRGLTQQEQALAQALAHNSQALATNTQAMQRAGQAKATMGQQARHSHGAIAELTQSFGALAASAIGLQALRSAMEGIVGAALKLEALNAAFGAITGSAKGAADAMAFVRGTAERLGVDVMSLAGGYKTLLSATDGTKMGLQAMQTLFLGVTEAGRAMQLSSEEIAGAIRPLGQILNQQAIQGDEWRTEFGTRIPKAMQLLLEATNGAVKTTNELTKAMEEGKLKGDIVYDIMANVGELLRNKYAPAAQAAAQGTGASFARLETAVKELQAAIGQGLNPALAESARALTAFIQLGKDGAGAFGGQFKQGIREATAAVIGLGGAVVVTGKYIAAMGAGIAFGPEAWKAGWDDVKQTFGDIIDLQNKIQKGGFAQQPSAPMAAPSANLRPITLGGGEEDKKRTKQTEAEKEATRVKREQLSLAKEINDAYEKALHTEREYTELQLKRAGFGEQARAALMTRVEETAILKEMNEEEKQRKDLANELQEALNKATYTERELLEIKLKSLKASQEDTAEMLKKFDATEKLKKAAEDRKKAEEDAVQATKDQASEIERLMKQLEPRRRNIPRQQQLQNTFSELMDETSDPYQLQQASEQMQETLDVEAWHDWRDAGLDAIHDLSSALTDFVFSGKASFQDFVSSAIQQLFRLASESAMRSLFNTDTVQGLLKTVGTLAGAWSGSTLPTTMGQYTTMAAAGAFSGRASGGPVSAGTPYLVGETGPELFVPRMSGTVVPHGQGMGGSPVVVNMHISTPNADSFQRSRGEIEASMALALQRAQRNL